MEISTSHGGLRKLLNVVESPVKVDTDGGSTGGVLSKAVDPKGTTDVRKQLLSLSSSVIYRARSCRERCGVDTYVLLVGATC